MKSTISRYGTGGGGGGIFSIAVQLRSVSLMGLRGGSQWKPKGIAKSNFVPPSTNPMGFGGFLLCGPGAHVADVWLWNMGSIQ